MLLRAVIYAFLAYILVRILQATGRVMRNSREARRQEPPNPAPPPPAAKKDFKDVRDADFVELPPEAKKDGDDSPR
jgi:hypothetical protein